MNEPYIELTQFEKLFRELSLEERSRFDELKTTVSDTLRQEALNRQQDLDKRIEHGEVLLSTVQQVVSDNIARVLTQPTDQPTLATSNAGGGDVVYIPSGGGVFIKKSELARLGILRQEVRRIKL
jgi:hypothetical protein